MRCSRSPNEVLGLLDKWPLLSVCANPNGSMGGSAGRDGTVRLWALTAGRSAAAHSAYLFRDLQEDLLCIAWSPDAQAIAVGSSKGSLHVLDAHDLSVRSSQLADAALGVITATSFRPDGQVRPREPDKYVHIHRSLGEAHASCAGVYRCRTHLCIRAMCYPNGSGGDSGEIYKRREPIPATSAACHALRAC